MVVPKNLLIAGAAVLSSAPALALQSQEPLIHKEQQDQVVLSAGKSSLVDSETLQSTIQASNLMARAKQLYAIATLSQEEYNHPTRVISSAGHNGTLDYIWSTISRLGDYYTLSKQPFPAVTGAVHESRLVLGTSVPESAVAMSLTPSTKDKQPVHAPLVLVANDGCQASDYPASISGNIAFIKRGTCSFGDKSSLAGQAGAAAAVVYDPNSPSLVGTLGTPVSDHVATFGLGADDAAPVVEKLQGGEAVDGIAYIDATVNIINTTNIIAQTTAGDPDNCVMLGAHTDSVADGPGINDDGSGTLSLLEVATQLARFDVNNCVRFAWVSAEEEGLLGSEYYSSHLTEEENLRIRLFMDYDMLASPNYALQVYNATDADSPVGSQALRDLYVDWYAARGLNSTMIEFDGRSDYVGFIVQGIPAGGIATGAERRKTAEEAAMFGGQAGIEYDPCYHQLCDDISNLHMAAWELNTKLVAHSVATFARSFDGFPNRTLDLKTKSQSAKQTTMKYRGSKLIL